VRALRILMVAACPFPARRGTPVRIERLCEALMARGHEVTLATYGLGVGSPPAGLRLCTVPDPPRRGSLPPGPQFAKLHLDPRLFLLLRRILASERFDVIHAHHIEALLLAALAARRHGIPVFYDAHTLLARELPDYGPTWLRAPLAALGFRLDRASCRRCAGVIAVTDAIRSDLVDHHGLAPERVVVATNGVEAELFTPSPTASPDHIVYTGNAAPYQDLPLLLHAFAKALRLRPGLRLRLCIEGDPGPLPALLAELGVEQAVELLSADFAELPRQLAPCGVAVSPRRNCPGIPQKLLNYMAAGKAIVASAGSAPILEHGRTGLLVPNGDIDAFASALAELAADPERAQSLGAAARAYVLERYSWDSAAGTVEDFYFRILGAGRQTTRDIAGAVPAQPSDAG